MKHTIFTLLVLFSLTAYGQINISTSSFYHETFDNISITTRTMPADTKIDKPAAVRTVGAYSAAFTQMNRAGGNGMLSDAGNGNYLFSAGDPATASDKAVGFLSSSTNTKSGNLYIYFKNNGSTPIKSLSIQYNIEKYRNGSNPKGYTVQLYYSTDGNNWTSMGDNFKTTFSKDDDSNGYSTAPGISIPLNAVFNLPAAVAGNENFYLAWNYSVTSGTDTYDAQALGIDDIRVTANSTLPVKLAGFSAEFVANTSRLGWTTVSEQNNKGFEILRSGNGTDFISIGWVKSHAADGNSAYGLNYSFTDFSPLPGTSYYQLQQTDINGTIEKSEIRAVDGKLDPEKSIMVYATDNEVKVQVYSAKKQIAKLQLFNLLGQKIYESIASMEQGQNYQTLPVALNNGIYVVSLAQGVDSTRKKFVK
ncbi:T9SS type A sorting domain-containing protein [Desertivirga xinjiangensis]|uniref:T9SS type A sorting domain-containing protein n=1 Tax=Desertivirga xinjiangensis TaxID=539206 RepID=UPI002109FBC7|nr:T9SS type A sorting domain-containing protein [Pedobacter xinjiangensis]